MADLTAKQLRFVNEYMIDLNATQAAIRAKYSEKTAEQAASRLLRNVKVSTEIKKRTAKLTKKAEITHEWVIKQLKKIYKRSMQAVPVCDREGNPLGEYKFEPNAANKSIELIGKHIGTFKENIQVSGKNGDPIKHELNVKTKICVDEINLRIKNYLGKD